ncbi:MAG: hypothetical protein HYV34_02220 [Candidatus Kerfeldbacteria bacterium]|nr:hypothetical protein [Candidatus Kerfeldbacteria bacterium]
MAVVFPLSLSAGNQPSDTNVYGWAWVGEDSGAGNPVFGWMSANCYNRWNAAFATHCPPNYGLKVNTDGSIQGFLWSGYTSNSGIGWIDFAPSGPYPTYPQHSARFFFEDTPADPNDPYDDVENPGNPDAAGYEAGQVAGWVRIVSLQQYGEGLGKDDWGWVQLRGSWAKEDGEYTQGTWIDFDTGQIYGWAWSGGFNGTPLESQGIGWIQLRNFTGGAQPFAPVFQAPFIEALQGNIYGQESVGIDEANNNRQSFAPPENNFNATYLIQSGGVIQHFVSEERGKSINILEPFTMTLDETLSLPQAGNRYQNTLSRLDLPGIRTPVEQVGGKKKNKYGHEIVESSETLTSRIFSNQTVLGGKIYVITPNNPQKELTVDRTFAIKNGAGVNSGAGLIIVDGDLKITKDVLYTGSPAANALGHIASLAWIVLGDITIQGGDAATAVTDLDGAYIALGRTDGQKGIIITGKSNEQLRVSGLLMAKAFQFQRTYIGGADKFENPKSSEQVTYDGRLHVNVPPGLEDFSAAFPIQRATLPK